MPRLDLYPGAQGEAQRVDIWVLMDASQDFYGGIKAKWLGYILQELSWVTQWGHKGSVIVVTPSTFS